MSAALLPIAIAAVLVLSLPLPIRWWTLTAAAIPLAALALAAMRGAAPAARPVTLALLTVAAIVFAYAAFALQRPGAFGTTTRVGYPFLVATGLRLEGGAWLAFLCGLVSVVPIVLRGSPRLRPPSSHAR